ncbi:MAG TPA: hypothetical protein PKD37_07135 [Oligoflexia bacterium]|nr:hypothetical protein [Oligoflexia bacterium]HMP27737.1 hypothetical protein [Oligoflexia bacterium]
MATICASCSLVNSMPALSALRRAEDTKVSTPPASPRDALCDASAKQFFYLYLWFKLCPCIQHL